MSYADARDTIVYRNRPLLLVDIRMSTKEMMN